MHLYHAPKCRERSTLASIQERSRAESSAGDFSSRANRTTHGAVLRTLTHTWVFKSYFHPLPAARDPGGDSFEPFRFIERSELYNSRAPLVLQSLGAPRRYRARNFGPEPSSAAAEEAESRKFSGGGFAADLYSWMMGRV